MFTPGQQKHYRPIVAAAWLEHCRRNEVPSDDKSARDEWYRSQLLAAGGWYTTKQCNPSDDFDTAMLHFAQIAGHDGWMERIARSSQRRMVHLINKRLEALSGLDGKLHTWDYACAIYRRMGSGKISMPENIHECPAELLWKVFQAIEAHIRRRLNEVPF